jgi:hypothetical protein
MRGTFWRRAAAVLALVLGIGVAAPAAQASATPTHGVGSTHAVTVQSDWWW